MSVSGWHARQLSVLRLLIGLLLAASTAFITVPASVAASTGGPVALGSRSVGANVDSNGAGSTEASQTSATLSGSVASLTVYIDAIPKAAAVVVGLYGDSGGQPGMLPTSISGLTAGSYTGHLTVTASRPPASPQFILVNLVVNSAAPPGGEDWRLDTSTADTFWVQSTRAPDASAGTVDIHDSAPTTDRWNYSGVEILPRSLKAENRVKGTFAS